MMSTNLLEFSEVEKAIHEAFKDVKKGNGIGIREAISIDDRGTAEDQAKARPLDIEEHWWDIPKNFNETIGTELSFTDKQGFKFLLPAVMMVKDTNSVSFQLCITKHPYDTHPHHGHKEYTEYLRSIHPKDVVAYFEFTPEQIHAIALFFKWWMQNEKEYLYADREKEIEGLKKINEMSKQYASSPENYVLTLEDEINNFNEQCRVLKEWLELGGVEI